MVASSTGSSTGTGREGEALVGEMTKKAPGAGSQRDFTADAANRLPGDVRGRSRIRERAPTWEQQE